MLLFLSFLIPTQVAVKQLDRNGFQGNREFLVEVLMLSLLKHPNLVNLVGYCADGEQRVLVYDYLCNGSLEDHLLGIFPNAYIHTNVRQHILVVHILITNFLFFSRFTSG